MEFKISKSFITIAFIMIGMTIVSSNLNWGKKGWQTIIEADGKGYYAYLPAVFIYHDLNFGFFDKIEKEKYYNVNQYYDYRSGAYGKVINKYYCGTAIAELPFFLVAHFFSNQLNYDADGYSKLYPILISIAALFYLFVGLVFINKILNIYDIDENKKSIVLIAAVFGTNLFYYSVGEPGMSHVFSFAFISMFVYFVKRYFLFFEKRDIFFTAIFLAMIMLIRPVNGLIIFSIPFLASNYFTLKKGFLLLVKNKTILVWCIFLFLSILSIQLILYKLSTDHFFIDSYGEEGFNFHEPHFFDVLFSYRKGLFLYTPMYLLSFFGLVFLYRNSKFEFFSWIIFFLLLTYVFSSWWMWYYGGSFSSRVYVEFIPVFMILLAITLKELKSKKATLIFSSIIFILVAICQIQTYQYRYYDIHWSDMTKEKYWDKFLMGNRFIFFE